MLKQQLKKLQKQADALCTSYRSLEAENKTLRCRNYVLEELLKQRNALLCIMERVAPDAITAAISVTQEQALDAKTEALLQELPNSPMSGTLTMIDEELHAHIMALTPASAAAFWIDKVREVALLMHMHERDPLTTLPALTATVASCIRWQHALHMFNPAVAYQLMDYNMLTGQHEPPPPQHWQQSATKGNFTTEQLESIAMLLSVVKPRLQQLEEEKQLLLEELASLPDNYGCGANEPNRAGPYNGCHTSSTNSYSSNSSNHSAITSNSEGSNITAATARLRQAQQRRQELTAQLNKNYTSWRIITGMRGQFLGCMCSAVQLGTGILTAFPYMPHGAPVLDHSSKLKSSQSQQDQQQEHQAQQPAFQEQQQQHQAQEQFDMQQCTGQFRNKLALSQPQGTRPRLQ